MGQRGFANRTVYSSSKHAIEGLTKNMALDLAAKGIRVNAIAPGLIETPMVSGMMANPDFLASMLKSIPLGRIGQPQDVACAVIYLASAAAAHVTGTCVNVDGGVTAQ
jgi:NAD(P)-dependent dehydrogenase (short-subunit alcohol dehydrogenase family)